jgi:hypothetical protein
MGYLALGANTPLIFFFNSGLAHLPAATRVLPEQLLILAFPVLAGRAGPAAFICLA